VHQVGNEYIVSQRDSKVARTPHKRKRQTTHIPTFQLFLFSF